jgi:pentatricopeptide repeat protein
MKRGTFTEALGNLFILIYMTLRQPNLAIDVWNHMLKSGLQPSLQTWDAMLSGCKASRDWKTLEVVWKRMLASGAQPDAVCWTTRISGLNRGIPSRSLEFELWTRWAASGLRQQKRNTQR